jgi:hypothetical protein
MNLGGKIVLVVLVVVIVLSSSILALSISQKELATSRESDSLPVVPLGQGVPASSRMNTSDVWVVIVGDVSEAYPISNYRASLIYDGEVLVGPETLKHGELGRKGMLFFDFFEAAPDGGCYPEPCDGLLSRGDYLRLSGVETGQTYHVRIHWAPTGQILSEVVVKT